jgi:ASC-1-like (ASCH) protein
MKKMVIELKHLNLYDDFKKYMYQIGYKNVCNMPTFGKILKNYANKFQYSIIHPKNVSTIVFNWELGCLV